MSDPAVSFESGRLRLKEPSGWCAAGNRFQRALTRLSDGAFKLFAYFKPAMDFPTTFNDRGARKEMDPMGELMALLS